jgi:hypothetical protein
MTLSITIKNAKLSIMTLETVMLSVIFAECPYAKCRYAECRGGKDTNGVMAKFKTFLNYSKKVLKHLSKRTVIPKDTSHAVILLS